MAIAPAMAEELSLPLRRVYADAEAELLRTVARYLAEGIETPQWVGRKLADIRRIRAELEDTIGDLATAGQTEIETAVETAYRNGSSAAVADLKQVQAAETISTGFGVTNEWAVSALIREATTKVQATHYAILRATEDAYRRAVAEATPFTVSGTMTRRQAAQRALNDLANRGVTGFVDKAGRNWSLDTYVEMAMRGAVANAAMNGHFDRFVENGRDLVVVSDSPEECPRCAKWERTVLSISGRTPGYPTVADARDAGLYHVGCTHSASLFISGLTKLGKPEANPTGYEERQHQRALERTIRKWKRREAVAMSDDERALARSYLRDAQAKMRDFIDETGRRRRYDRESLAAR